MTDRGHADRVALHPPGSPDPDERQHAQPESASDPSIGQSDLVAAMHEATRRLTVLAGLTAELSGARNPRSVLERAVDAAAELFGAEGTAVFLLRPDGQSFDIAVARGLAPLNAGVPALSLEKSIAGRALLSNSVLAVEDAAVERAAGIAFPRLAGDAPIGAVLVAPVSEGDAAPVGVVEVYAVASRSWPDEDRELLRTLAAACAAALRSTREIERAQQDANRFRALAEIGAALYSSDDLDAVLHRLARGAGLALRVSRVVLIRAAAPGEQISITHEFTASNIRPASELADVAYSRMWSETVSQGHRPRPIVVDDIRDNAALAARWAPIEEAQRPRSILAIPLIEEARATGVMVLHQCGWQRRWEPKEVAFVQALAAQTAMALRHKRLLDTMLEDTRRLAALNHIAEAMIGAPTFGAMCDRVLVALIEALAAGVGAIHVYDQTAPAERALRMVAWHGLSEDAVSAWSAIPLGHGVVGQAALRRAIVFAEDIDATPPASRATLPVVRREELEARICVPMLARGRLLGVLTVAARQRRAWSEADFSMLETVANQLAMVLEAEDLRSAAAATAAAREADRLKTELLSTVSHELRTPLGAIKGFASGLLFYGDRLDEAERLDSVRCISDAADRLAELIDNLLGLQRLEAGLLAVTHDVVDLADIARNVVGEMARQAPNHTIEIRSPSVRLCVRGDPRRLRQVLQNLLDNAIKYSPDGARIGVQLAGRDGTVELRVEDEGIGIPLDHLPLIFERFHRVDSSMTRRIGGTGLGLAIVKGLVTAHEGTIQVHSDGEGHGSVFVVTLPAIAEPDEAP